MGPNYPNLHSSAKVRHINQMGSVNELMEDVEPYDNENTKATREVFLESQND